MSLQKCPKVLWRIRLGQEANVRVDAFADKRFNAQVSEIAPRASKQDNVTSFEVTLSLENPSSKLRIGMTVDIEFQSNATDISTLVPTVAIVTENGQPGVLIVGQKKQPRFQKVELGTSSGSKTAIIKGINPTMVKAISCHHPDLFVSCSLLAPTANDGKAVATVIIHPIGPVTSAE